MKEAMWPLGAEGHGAAAGRAQRGDVAAGCQEGRGVTAGRTEGCDVSPNIVIGRAEGHDVNAGRTEGPTAAEDTLRAKAGLGRQVLATSEQPVCFLHRCFQSEFEA